MADLFADTVRFEPLAARMRPRVLEEYAGQTHLLGPGKPLREAIEHGRLHSMIFWGPPGVGKTTLAQLLAHYIRARFVTLSAVLAGVKEIRASVQEAEHALHRGQKTILFVDEVHRFNKAQQDAFLPYVENGTVIFIGATTENPAFELNNALLSRARVYVLKNLEKSDIVALLQRAVSDSQKGLGALGIQCDAAALNAIAAVADGDPRRALNLLEIGADFALSSPGHEITPDILSQITAQTIRRFDKGGDYFYDQISALHKSVRGTNPDGALYWFARMLDGGCDPLYIARRVVRMASEDIGNADPRALQLALNAWDVQERLGSPEGELAIAQAVVYMACAPKSNAVYMALKQVRQVVNETGSLEVPEHLRNAPTPLAKQLGHGKEYQYAHDYPNAYVPGESYLPPRLAERCWYEPAPRGLEAKIQEKLKWLRQQDEASEWHRYPSASD